MGNVISFFFSSRRRHTRWPRDWSSDVCSSDLNFLRHGSAQNGAGERGSLIGWQGDVAEDDADPAAIKWAGDGIAPRLPPGVQGEMNHRVELFEQGGVELQTFRIKAEVLDKTTDQGINLGRDAGAGIEG